MSLRDQSTLRVILYEGEGAQPLDAADRFTALTSLLEPLLMVGLGGSIGCLLVAMYLPIFKIADAVN